MGRTGIDVVAARTARLIALHGDQVGVDVSDVIDDLLALGDGASRPTPGRGDRSEPEGMLGLRELLKTSS